MPTVTIDLAEQIQQLALSKEEVSSLSNYLLDRIVDEYMSKWENIINTELKGTRVEYEKAMYTERPDDRTAIIGMTARKSTLALMIETGASAFDEKLGFENSSKKHMKKNGGWYLTIPFSRAASDEIMSQMLPGSTVSVHDLMMQGGTLTPKTLPQGFNETQTHALQLNTGKMITYQHKSPIFEGMKRTEIGSTINEKRGGFVTFRRVSDKSDEDSWMHPGFEARNFMDKALADTQIPQVVSDAVKEFVDKKFS